MSHLKGEKSGFRGEICPIAYLPTTNPKRTGLISDPIPSGGPAINRPIHGTYAKHTKCINVLIITVKYDINGKLSTAAKIRSVPVISSILYSTFHIVVSFLASLQSY